MGTPYRDVCDRQGGKRVSLLDKLQVEKENLEKMNNFQVGMADNTWGLSSANQHILPEVLSNEWITD